MGRSYVSKMAFPGVPFQSDVPLNDPNVVFIDTQHFRVPALLFRPSRNAARATVLYLHGNAMAISQMEDLARQLCVSLNCNILVPEIPGSQYDWGREAFKDPKAVCPASEASYFEAAIGAFDYAQKEFEGLPVIVWGQSLGTGAACEVGVTRKPNAIVLQSPLMSAVRVVFPRLFTVPLTDIMVNINKVSHFECPTLIMHGTVDEVIHVDHGKRLAQLVPEGRLFALELLEGAGHNDMELLFWERMLGKVGELVAHACESKK